MGFRRPIYAKGRLKAAWVLYRTVAWALPRITFAEMMANGMRFSMFSWAKPTLRLSVLLNGKLQVGLTVLALSLTLSRGERGLGCRLLLRFRQFLTSLKLRFQTTSWNTEGTRIDRQNQRFRPIAVRTRVYAANSEATATRPLSPRERARERAVSRRLASKPITLSQSLCTEN